MGGIKGGVVCFLLSECQCAQTYSSLFERSLHETRVAKLLLLAEVLDFLRATQQFCFRRVSDGFLDSCYLTGPVE